MSDKGLTDTIQLHVKEPDVFQDMAHALELSDEKRREYLLFGEYASIELVVDSDLMIVGGRFLKVKR